MSVPNYCCDYRRQEQMVEALQWLCGKNLPAVCTGNPHLYCLASKGGDEMSVLLISFFMDEIIAPQITLDGAYSQIKCVNCTAEIHGNKVTLSDIMPYGVAAFAVK